MKKISLMAIALSFICLSSCGDKAKLSQAEQRNAELEGDVSELIATQDSLFMLVNDITEGMNQIKEMERIIATPEGLSSESPSRKEQIKNDIIAIQQALEERRLRLDELEKRLSAATSENATMKKTIAALKTQIADQQTEIAQLKNQLAAANVQIKELGNTVAQQSTQIDNLNKTVQNESRERQIAQSQAQNLSQELNVCYYAIGSSKELKKNGILQGSFLGIKGTKVLEGKNINWNYFTKADKRTLKTINTHNKKAEIKSNNPKDSYTITDVDGEAVITITNPSRFWSISDYLIIKVG